MGGDDDDEDDDDDDDGFGNFVLFLIEKNLISFFSVSPSSFSDNVPSLFRSFEEYDLPLRAWNLPNVWRSYVGVSNMPQSRGQTHFALLKRLSVSTNVYYRNNYYLKT